MENEDEKSNANVDDKSEKKGKEAEQMALGGGFSSIIADVTLFGNYDIGRDVFEPWHKCAYVFDDDKRCNYVNVISEFDPENPPVCPNKKKINGKIIKHSFTPPKEVSFHVRFGAH
jgi:hypothetical protein